VLFARLQHQFRRDGGIRNYQTYPTIPSLPIIIESNTTFTIILNNFQQHVSALTSHLRAEYKCEYTIQCQKSFQHSYNAHNSKKTVSNVHLYTTPYAYTVNHIRGRTIKLANSPCACRGSTGQKP